MKVKCIKLMCAHWGVFFNVGKWYTISNISPKKVEIILNKEEYLEELKSITKFLPDILASSGNKLQRLVDEQKDLIDKSKRLLSIVYIDNFIIKDNNGDSHNFISLTRNELLDKYGSDNFSTSVDIFEDYFEPIDKIRQDNIDKIINND